MGALTLILLALGGLLVGAVEGALFGLHDSWWLDQYFAKGKGKPVLAPIVLRRHVAGLLCRGAAWVNPFLGVWLLASLPSAGLAVVAVALLLGIGVGHHVAHNVSQGQPILSDILDYDV